MDYQVILSQVAVSFIGALLALLLVYLLLKDKLISPQSPLGQNVPVKSVNDGAEERIRLLPLKLQAHERLILFIERINPTNLFIRLYQQGISVVELQALILNEIRAEYQHNVAQQLYVDNATWDVVRKLKDDTLAMINNGVKSLPDDAAGIELSRMVLEHIASLENSPYDLTLNLIKKEIQQSL